jgi:predicted anti-sigma-YlaC factor YlaD
MSCQELTDRLHDYLGGDVDRADLRVIEDHLKVCDRCLRYACEYELTLRLARSAAGQEA